MPRRRGRPIGVVAALLFVLGLAGSGIESGDSRLFPGQGPDAVTIYLVSNGYHSGLILPRLDAAAAARRAGDGAVASVTTRFAHYDWIEAGWGESRFYREVPTVASFSWGSALRALFRPGNGSVMHIVGIEGDPHDVYANSDLVKLRLSPAGFERLLAGIDHSFDRNEAGLPIDLGPGLYGPSLFYGAVGAFSILQLCNHWTARQLALAGVPVWPLAATLPRGLLLDLALRSGLTVEPQPLSVSTSTQ